MAALWPNSRIPQFDNSGDLLIGGKAYFYNEGTSTPQVVYSDSGLSVPLDQPVLSEANGRFPAVYLNTTPGSYRQRVLDADDVVIFDDDGVSVNQAADYVPPDTGSTDVTLLFRTGDIKARHGTGAHSGWVRAAGRTIGSATSGATERANADTSALYQFLWGADSTLAVSGGRGATAAGDFAANKTIALPDYRERTLVGLADMGNTASSLLSGNTVDNSEDTITLGATVGTGTHTLTTPQIPSHTHTATFAGDALAPHSHNFNVSGADSPDQIAAGGSNAGATATTSTTNTSGGTPSGTVTVANAGGGGAHPNAQPSVLVTWYLKL